MISGLRLQNEAMGPQFDLDKEEVSGETIQSYLGSKKNSLLRVNVNIASGKMRREKM